VTELPHGWLCTSAGGLRWLLSSSKGIKQRSTEEEGGESINVISPGGAVKTRNDNRPHLGSKDDPDSFFRNKCGRGSGDSGEGELGLRLSVVLSSAGNWVGGVAEEGDDLREMYGGGRGFGCSSRTGEPTMATDVSSASDRSSRMARGGGRST
jgi:hypothetical protein